MAEKKNIIWATGRRKTAVARIRLFPGAGTVTVNERALENYFPRDTARMKFEGTQFFVKSHDEMVRVFKDSPDVVSRTVGIAERCNLRLEKVATPFPQFDVPPGFTIDSYFVHVTREGFARRMEALRPLHEQGKLKHPIVDYSLSYARTMELEVRLLEKEWTGEPGLFAQARLRVDHVVRSAACGKTVRQIIIDVPAVRARS